MDDMQSKFNAILNDPQMMQKIMAMAQSLGQTPPTQPETQKPEPPAPSKQENPGFSLPDIDIGMLKNFAGITQKSSIDGNQRALLKALGPYLSSERVMKLERAMQAAKMAGLASVFLGKHMQHSNQGR